MRERERDERVAESSATDAFSGTGAFCHKCWMVEQLIDMWQDMNGCGKKKTKL